MLWLLFLVHQHLKLYMRHVVDIILSSSALETLHVIMLWILFLVHQHLKLYMRHDCGYYF